MVAYRQENNYVIVLSEEEETAFNEEKTTANAAMLEIGNRETRNQLLMESDWTQMPDSPLADDAKTSWATYRTALRNLPTNENWPSLGDDDWPVSP